MCASTILLGFCRELLKNAGTLCMPVQFAHGFRARDALIERERIGEWPHHFTAFFERNYGDVAVAARDAACSARDITVPYRIATGAVVNRVGRRTFNCKRIQLGECVDAHHRPMILAVADDRELL